MSDVNNIEEQDILEDFRTAVRNGQTRLALEILVDVIDSIVEKVFPIVEILEPTKETPQTVQSVQVETVNEKLSPKKKTKKDEPITAVTE
jgi:hypothetical protein